MRAAIEWNLEAGAIKNFISDVLGQYSALGDKLHAAAILGFVHAANHGDAQYLTVFFDGLRENDSNMLKAWLLKFSTYTDVVAGEEVKKQWIGYRSTTKDAKHPVGFFVKPKTEAVRKDKFAADVMWQGEAFFDVADKGGKPMTLEMIYAFLEKLDKSVTSKEEKASEASDTGNVSIDKDMRAALKDISAKAALAKAALSAAKPAGNA